MSSAVGCETRLWASVALTPSDNITHETSLIRDTTLRLGPQYGLRNADGPGAQLPWDGNGSGHSLCLVDGAMKFGQGVEREDMWNAGVEISTGETAAA